MATKKEISNRGNILFPFQHYKMTNPNGDWFVPYHWHEEYEIIYCIEGSVTLQLNGVSYLLHAGDICFVNRGELHQFHSEDRQTSYYAYVFPMEKLQLPADDYCQKKFLSPLLAGTLFFPASLPRASACYPLILDEIKRIIQVNEQKTPAYQLMTKACLLKIIAALSAEGLLGNTSFRSPEVSDKDYQRIYNITEWLKKHLGEKLTLEQAALTFHMSPKYFSRYFKKMFQKSFCEYLNHLRIEKACLLLISTADSISDIACRCGFENASYFIRKFREQTGKTPLHYRKS